MGWFSSGATRGSAQADGKAEAEPLPGRWGRRRHKRPAKASPPRALRLPPSLVADILLADPWQHTPPRLEQICRGHSALTAEVFRDARLAVFSEPRVVAQLRARHEAGEQEVEPLAVSVRRQWQALPPRQLRALADVPMLLVRSAGENNLLFSGTPYTKLKRAVEQMGDSAYAQRLFVHHATPRQLRLFGPRLLFDLRDASLLPALVRAGLDVFCLPMEEDLINETGIFARELYGRAAPAADSNWLAEALRGGWGAESCHLWPKLQALLAEIVEAQTVLHAVGELMSLPEDEVAARDHRLRQHNHLKELERFMLSRSLSFARARAFDFSVVDALPVFGRTATEDGHWDRHEHARRFRQQPRFAGHVRQRAAWVQLANAA